MTHILSVLSASAGMRGEGHDVTHALLKFTGKELADHASYHLLLQCQDLSLLLRWQTLNLSW